MKWKWMVTVAAASLLLNLTGWPLTAVRADNSVDNDNAYKVKPIELTVSAQTGRHAISPDIYGINHYSIDDNLRDEFPIPVVREGGNHTETYNWLVDSSNKGTDQFFIGGNGTDHPTPGGEYDNIVAANKSHGSKSIVTVPITGYVNKYSQYNCSYPSSLYPKQGVAFGWTDFFPFITDMNGDKCGSGLDPDQDGQQLADVDPLRNYIKVDPAWMRDWIEHLRATHGTASDGGVKYYQLDNEPESWNYLHHDIHPEGTGFDELVKLNTDYAAMIKDVDPGAKVLGAGNCCMWSFYDMGGPATDNQQSHGGKAWYPYYLQQMRKAETEHGRRLIDYLDFHYYPNGSNLLTWTSPDPGDPETQTRRLISTRSMWDPTFTDPSGFGEAFGKLDIIPRMRGWINTYYPGTKLSMTEYSFGALGSLNGALAQADLLGIFGREGLDMATLWGPPKATDPGAFAFKMYRNYDGKGSQYGDTWVESWSEDQDKLAVYGAQRQSDGALTVMVINKTGDDLKSTLKINDFKVNSKNAKVYTYSGANLSQIVRQQDQEVAGVNIKRSFPANSVTLIVLSGHTVGKEKCGSGLPGRGIQTGPVPAINNQTE
ncbi:endoglucanase (plasmid) [Paenibacillus rhizovicinus]|uniref:Endoglucanase n=1 Tax=Paenibacillus rhizovicinus TaxID=2704463 RepID=A0A6C0PAV1_9BACL|nr:glycoside hydrolase family 44 protein [Paenibacillus rhizovicinus]QHW35501.1 endoglucanase [Paenibacillus rhizovicinus]